MVVSNYNDGKIEGKSIERNIEIAKNMKDAGMTKEAIQQITGLSIDEIDRIFCAE